MGAILVTGGAGFIGSHLCERLIRGGREVVCLDVFDSFYSKTVKLRNIASLKDVESFHLYEGDIRDPAVLEDLFGHHGVEAVVHLAARAGVRPSLEMPRLYTDVNVTGTATLMEHARIYKVKRFVFGSSSSVYGNNDQAPFSEKVPADFPVSPYAATKRAGELLAYTYHHLYGMDVACLRFFTVYGPRQRPEMAIHKFTRLIDQGEPVPLFGDGSSSRDYTYVEDIVSGIVAALEHSRGFQVFNLGRSEVVSLRALIGHLEAALGKTAKIVTQRDQPGDVQVTCADLEHSRSVLGYAPQVGIQEGIRRFVEWYRAQKQA
ncbi:MAG TPA: GDP-mannose 4,6-dehydratase [Candidatus Polarisedimenticolia bacterium]|nr:GDP-mannose 4,6-dehydratase [Candidatus Polarisedimenticolia bacterium]